jgi:hypothetical protein
MKQGFEEKVMPMLNLAGRVSVMAVGGCRP